MIGKHYILTGGTSGLGKAILKILLKKRVFVTVIVRNPQKLDDIIAQYGTEHLSIIQCDLQSQAQILKLKHHLQDQSIDGLIYSSGLGYFKSIEQHSIDEMLETYTLNIMNFNILMTAIQPFLSTHPSIVGIGSQSAFLTQAYAAHYVAAMPQLISANRKGKFILPVTKDIRFHPCQLHSLSHGIAFFHTTPPHEIVAVHKTNRSGCQTASVWTIA